jgi:hypothetical protein
MHPQPLVLTKVCKSCGEPVVLERVGPPHLLQGHFRSWYTTSHRCAESERAIAALASEREQLGHVLFDGATGS